MREDSPYDPAAYGRACAEYYDELYGPVRPAVVAALLDLAGGGRALEFGIGTGRTARALAARGLTVCGIEASAAMVRELRARPGGAAIPVVVGDFAEATAEGPFALVFALVSTLWLLPPEAQARCVRNAAHHLDPGGHFLVEASVPSDAEPAGFEHAITTSRGVRRYRAVVHPVPPAALDRMAADAGLRLVHRWATWARAPFTPGSASHVSVYRREAGGATPCRALVTAAPYPCVASPSDPIPWPAARPRPSSSTSPTSPTTAAPSSPPSATSCERTSPRATARG